MVSTHPSLLLAHHLLGEMPETRDVVITLLLFLKPALVPCSSPAGHNPSAWPITQVAVFPFHAYNVFDHLPEPPTDVVLLPLHQARRHDDLKPNQSCYRV
jgi:hypothetical protein